MLNTKTQLFLSAQAGINPVTMITAVKYNASLVKTLNNITFLYDPNWKYEEGNPTYPIAFFYVKSMTESMTSEISSKPLLFYNSATDAKDGTSSGILNIVADNVVIKPKLYRMDILVPANSTTFNNSVFETESMANVMRFIASKDHKANSAGLSEVNNMIGISFDLVSSLLKGLYGSALNVSSICNMLLQQQDYNKASIEYMWRNRRVLKLKLWNGWKFMYLVIQNFEITKTGENGDYYEGTLLCQELPILTFRNQESSSLSILSTISSEFGKGIKKATDLFINAMTTNFGE